MKVSAVLTIKTKIAFLAVTLGTLPRLRSITVLTSRLTLEAVSSVALELVVSGIALFAHFCPRALIAAISALVASVVLQVVALITQLAVLA